MFKKLISNTLNGPKKDQKEYNSYTPFVRDHESRPIPEGLITRYARLDDAQEIAEILTENNLDPGLNYSYFLERTKKELVRGGNLPGFHIIVAIVDDEIVGYARSILYSQDMINKYTYPAPSGWYLMGVTVRPDFRGAGIGAILTKERLKHIKQISSKAYYIVNAKNKTSIKMHERFGFKLIQKGPGFLKVRFNEGLGMLYECDLIEAKIG